MALALATVKVSGAVQPGQRWHGLNVNRQGVLEKDGRPYRGIGANYVGALRQLLRNSDKPSVLHDLQQLHQYHIPFIRFPALAAWGSPARCRAYLLKVYASAPQRYFHAMDKLCAMANRYHIGLIPSLFFTRWPNDLAGQKGLTAWNNKHSRTYKIWTTYVKNMVRRYAHNRAIWGWEFGNELNLNVDLPNAGQHGGYLPSLGYTHVQMWALYTRFVRLIRRYDPQHIIEAGNSRPRWSSWHNMVKHSWQRDTLHQWATMLKKDNAAFDMVCVHEYGASAPANIARVAVLAARWHKPVFVGEFGVPGSKAKSRRLFNAMLQSIVESNIALSAVWAFDEPHQTYGKEDYSITATNNRRYMLAAIESANLRLMRGRP